MAIRKINSIADAQKAFNDLNDWISLHSTKDWNFNGLRIKNASDAVDQQDYVTLAQLQSPKNADAVDNDFYTIVFDKDGEVNDGDLSAEFVIGQGRQGQPTEVWVKCKAGFEPSGGDLIINVSWTRYNQIGGATITNLLATDLHLPLELPIPLKHPTLLIQYLRLESEVLLIK